MTPIRIALLPLTDCAILAVARELGIAEKHGIALELVRDLSWATIRDQLVYRQVQLWIYSRFVRRGLPYRLPRRGTDGLQRLPV